MTVYIDKKIKIDRIKFGHLGILFETFKYFKYCVVLDYQSINPKIFGHKFIKTRITKYTASITYKLNKHKPVLRIEAGSSKNKLCYVTWEIWPKNINKSNIYEFIETIEVLMDYEPCFTYKIASSIGKITYLELACDLKTPNIYDLIFWKAKTRIGNTYVKSDDKSKGAIYLGAKTSTIQFRIYDKAKQLQESGQKTSWKNYTRIEAILRKTQLTLNELVNLKSPFTDLHIACAINCKEKWQDSSWINFIKQATDMGYPSAISSLNKQTRKIFQTRLKKCSVKFWKPESLLSNISKEIDYLQAESIAGL